MILKNQQSEKIIMDFINKRLLLFSFFLFICLAATGRKFSLLDSAMFNKITTANDLQARQDAQWTVKLGGFIGTDLFWDTRQVVESRDGLVLFYPENVRQDINGRDINARPSFNFSVLNTRLTIRIQAPDALGAKISGMVEGWFAGISNNDMNGFAMRHAFLKMDWKKGTSLLIGQSWHPLFTENCFSNTVAGSAGAPFQPFSRAPQIRLSQSFCRSSTIMIYINSQRDFLSFGSAGNSSSYLRNSAVPEMGLQYIFKHNKTENEKIKNEFLIGTGIDYKYLIPRVVTDSNVYTRNGLHAFTAIIFSHYQKYLSKNISLGIKAKALYGNACNDFLLLGGYAYQYYDNQPLNTAVNYSYTALNTLAGWIDIYAKMEKKWEVGLFGGYTQNLGSNKNIQDWNNPNAYFSRGYDIKYLYRVSVRAVYQANKLQFGLEPEYTVACYGNIRNSLGEVQIKSSADYPNVEKNMVANLRVLFATILYF